MSISSSEGQSTPATSVHCLRIIEPNELFEEALGDIYSEKYFDKHKIEFSSPLFIFEISTNEKTFSTFFKNRDQLTSHFQKSQNNAYLSSESKEKLTTIDSQTTQQQGKIFQVLIRQSVINGNLLFFQHIPGCYGTFLMGKRSGGRFKESSCCKMGQIFKMWKNRKIAIFKKGLCYYNEKNEVREFLPFSQSFYFQFGLQATALQFGIILHTTHRKLSLEAKNINDFILFLFVLRKATHDCSYVSLNRFNSFAPLRNHNDIKFLVDGEEFFEALAKSLQEAEKSILITGWMISPQFLLRRGTNSISLYDLLSNASSKGVKTKIVVYFQSCFLTNDSLYAKETLEKINGLKVIRHPCDKIPVLWSHHGKLVIIDQKKAFVGGLDLCYGRYDNQIHKIFPQQQLYPGIQHNNSRKDDQIRVRQPTISNIPREQCRLPWHDIGSEIVGDIVPDLVHHFFQIWNFARYENQLEPTLQSYSPSVFLAEPPSTVFTSTKIPGQEDQQKAIGFFRSIGNKIDTGLGAIKRTSIKAHSLLFNQAEERGQVEPKVKQIARKTRNSQDLFQAYVQEVTQQIKNKQQTQEKLILKNNRNSRISARKLSANHIKQIKQTLNVSQKIATKKKVSKTNSFVLTGDKLIDYMSLQINGDYVRCLNELKQAQQKNIETQKVKIRFQSIEIIDESDSQMQQQTFRAFTPEFTWQGRDQCQVLRSVGNWSLGLDITSIQFSIQIAYLQLISQAKHYIYIENQFFISSTADETKVHNKIAIALYLRIKKAIDLNQNFRVYILLPLIPGFAGDLQAEQCLLLRKEMQWQYDTICRGPNSLWQRLLEHTNDPGKYIQFYGLRSHGRYEQSSTPQTEIIYIHSKLMIIDDQIVLCGSANINDRSLLGNRDSEIAIVTKGESFIEGVIDSSQVVVSQLAYDLRIKLWSEHFGMAAQQMMDPVSSKTWNAIIDRAGKNTDMYRKVFGCYPDDNMRTRLEIAKVKKESDITLYDQLHPEIKGNIVEFPMRFLEEEPLTFLMTEKEFYMPSECLT